MNIWQADFYKHQSKNESGQPLWELLICAPTGQIIYQSHCPQSQASVEWLVTQLKPLLKIQIPDLIQVFRPQTLNLFSTVAEKLSIKVEATRRTPALKNILKNRFSDFNYNPIKLEQLPPQALPENLWGDEWRFAAFPAGEIIEFFQERPLPILEMPSELFPINLGIASPISIPGIIIYGGRKSRYLARWLESINPGALNYIPTAIELSGGLVLEAGLIDRWILATFEDLEVAKAAQNYQKRKQDSQGLHFLLVQPDDSVMTYTGFWLLKDEEN
jgi:hypothetical protein